VDEFNELVWVKFVVPVSIVHTHHLVRASQCLRGSVGRWTQLSKVGRWTQLSNVFEEDCNFILRDETASVVLQVAPNVNINITKTLQPIAFLYPVTCHRTACLY
jgi:hypothetical protein